MKTNLLSILIPCSFAIIFLNSCESHEQKADYAFERVKEQKYEDEKEGPILIANDSTKINKEPIQEIAKTKTIIKYETVNEWTIFTTEIEKKILANEISIKELKGTPYADAKLLKKIIRIEKSNYDFKKQLLAYDEEVKMKWENFRTKMNQDINEVNVELKDLETLTNK